MKAQAIVSKRGKYYEIKIYENNNLIFSSAQSLELLTPEEVNITIIAFEHGVARGRQQPFECEVIF